MPTSVAEGGGRKLRVAAASFFAAARGSPESVVGARAEHKRRCSAAGAASQCSAQRMQMCSAIARRSFAQQHATKTQLGCAAQRAHSDARFCSTAEREAHVIRPPPTARLSPETGAAEAASYRRVASNCAAPATAEQPPSIGLE